MSSATPPSPTPLPRTLAISWEEHRRTREICDWFQLPLHTLTCQGSGWRRYLNLTLKTAKLLFATRPSIVFVQNPSLVLALLTMTLRPFCGRYRVIMDAHNEAVAPFAHTFWPIPQLSRLALRWADLTIVTNAALAEQVKNIGGRPHVLPDRLPTAPLQPNALPLSTPIEIMVVATYAPDEPIAEIVEAARQVGPEYRFHITGRKNKLPREQQERLPANVIQTDFLSEEAYWQLMADSHFVLDLTLKPNCLVCGAYEALALAKPMILTGNPATVDLFGPVAVFPADSTAQDIARALHESRARYSELGSKAQQHKVSFAQRWMERAGDLALTISRWSARPASE